MKIFYAVQATGNGHISRAMEILPHLKKYGDVDIFLSGSNSALQLDANVKYRSRGLSLFYSNNGGLHYGRIARSLSPFRIIQEMRQLPVEKYDLVINDFESITALACAYKKVESIHFGHQASFMSDLTPRPAGKNRFGELVLKNYAKASKYIGLHFERYDEFILPPVIKREIWNAEPADKKHITVYLMAYSDKKLASILSKLKQYRFEIFSREVKSIVKTANLTFIPVNQKLFNESLVNCSGIVTGAGFETPAEALHLGKKLMVIPVKGQYEQLCNAAALERKGVTVLEKMEEDFSEHFTRWMENTAVPDIRFFKDSRAIVTNMMEKAFASNISYQVPAGHQLLWE